MSLCVSFHLQLMTPETITSVPSPSAMVSSHAVKYL